MTPKQLQAALTQLDMSQLELASKLGVTQSAVFRWLTDIPKFRRKIPGPVAAAVNCWLEAAKKGGSKK